MNMHLVGLAVVVCVLGGAVRGAEGHPLKKAKVGDWVEYINTARFGEAGSSNETRRRLIAKTEAEATLEVTTRTVVKETITVGGDGTVTKDTISKSGDGKVTIDQQHREDKQQVTVKLTGNYDLRKAMVGKDAELTGFAEGDEAITVAGKSFKTHWTSFEVKTGQQNAQTTTRTKLWVSPDVPLDGLVKMETEVVGMGKATMELKSFGRGQ